MFGELAHRDLVLGLVSDLEDKHGELLGGRDWEAKFQHRANDIFERGMQEDNRCPEYVSLRGRTSRLDRAV